MEVSVFNNIPAAILSFESDDKGAYKNLCCNEELKRISNGNLAEINVDNLPDNVAALLDKILLCAARSRSSFFYQTDDGRSFKVSVSKRDRTFIAVFTELFAQTRMVDNLAVGIVETDSDEKITYINNKAKKITGCKDALGHHAENVINLTAELACSNDLKNTPAVIPKLLNLSHDSSKEYVLRSAKGQAIPVSINTEKKENGGHVFAITDLSQIVDLKKEIDYLKYHDRLTGLYNRTYFEKEVLEFNQKDNYPIAIILGDVNGLKMTNDVFGNRKGDQILITVANIFSLACHDKDILVRYGGDEFAAIMPNTDLEATQRTVKNILDLCAMEHCGHAKISLSIGYSCQENVANSLSEAVNTAEDYMFRNKMLDDKSYRSSFVSSLKSILYNKSYETEQHAMRIMGLCTEVGRQMGLPENEMNDLSLFSMLHDIGKIGVKDQVLSKPGKLTNEEWTEMRSHSTIGYRIARSSPELQSVAKYILFHHERFDGNGYPKGLKGEEIPLLSRILAVADSYDAMVNDRCYRKAMPKEEAIAEIKRCSGSQFDPKVTDYFLKALEKIDSEDNALKQNNI